MQVIRWWRRRGLRSCLGVTIALPAIVLLASCTPVASGQGRASATPGGRVISLTRISTLKSLFNRDAGHPRLLLLFSPT